MLKLAEDKLERNEFLNELFNLFDNFGNYDDGGLTISINGKYGSGKSTLLNFIEEKNSQQNKYNIIRYDAWQNNLFDNPLIPILYSLNGLKSTKSKIKQVAKKIITNLPKIISNTLANVHGIDISSLFVNSNIFEDYKRYIDAVSQYKKVLAEFCCNQKTILLIDELDRCLPQYQIKVLETLYNIFNIPNLILVIALDRNQLEHSIKEIFGNQQNVAGYLSKFIQYEIELPEDKNNKYLEKLIMFQCKYPEIKKICAKMFKLADISLRDCLQIVRELNLICNEKYQNGQPFQYFYWYPLFVCFILIVKKQNRSLYKKYFYNDLSNNTQRDNLPLKQTVYYQFLKDLENTKLEAIISYFISKEMNFAFILYFINYFHPIGHVDVNSIVEYIHYDIKRIESIINDWDIPMWNSYDFNEVLSKIRVFK